MVRCQAESCEVGIRLLSSQVNIIDGLTQFNIAEGVSIPPFYKYDFTALSDVPLSALGIYGGAYNVVYTANDISLVPTSYQPHPDSIIIGGKVITVPPPNIMSGPRVYLQNEIDISRNGLYAVGLFPMVFSTGETGTIYKFLRVDPWISGNVMPMQTRALLENGTQRQVYSLLNDTLIGTNNPIIIPVQEKSEKVQINICDLASLSNGSPDTGSCRNGVYKKMRCEKKQCCKR